MAVADSQADVATAAAVPPHFLADVYTFHWDELSLRLPAVSALTVALCLAVSIRAGYPAAGLAAGGGALTIGFGANQRIADSRVWPMLSGVLAMAAATVVGSLVGHRGIWLILASSAAAALYGVLTVRHSGLAWVGQQASVALFVSSAFPTGPGPAFERAGLIAAGGLLQVVMTSAGLRAMPELQKDLLAIPRSLYHSLYARRRELLARLHQLEDALPAPDRRTALLYALRLTITVALASEIYRWWGVQSGYWIPMTALLVQKPAFFETASRGLLRVLGTLAGAGLTTLVASHLHLGVWTLAALATLFAYLCFATVTVNYGLFTLCLTSHIVFLLSLNQVPGPEIARRRAICTAVGALLALVIHLDGLRRHRAVALAQPVSA